MKPSEKFFTFLDGMIKGMVYIGGVCAFFHFYRSDTIPLFIEILGCLLVLCYAYSHLVCKEHKEKIEDLDLKWETNITKLVVMLCESQKAHKKAEKQNEIE